MDGARRRHDAVLWGTAKGANPRGVALHQLTGGMMLSLKMVRLKV